MGAIAILEQLSNEHAGAKALGGPPRAPFVSDLRELPAETLPHLPLPPRLGLLVSGVPGVIRVDPFGDEPDEAGTCAITLDADEWVSLVIATQSDRVWPMDLRLFCERKLADPAWRLDLDVALAGGRPDRSERWSLARVLMRLDAALLSVEI